MLGDSNINLRTGVIKSQSAISKDTCGTSNHGRVTTCLVFTEQGLIIEIKITFTILAKAMNYLAVLLLIYLGPAFYFILFIYFY